ncbi:MAG: hypothetical protein IEMM0008_1429 [bacterium]|nr:MAG: hypothetical protein IEMM0008_1429 [bacterium]
MFKKSVFMIILVLAVSQFAFGDNNKAYKNTHLGIQFNYASNYKVTTSAKKGYHEIKLESTDRAGGIIIQKFKVKLTDRIEKIYMDAVIKTLKSKGLKELSHKHKDITLPVKKLYKSRATKAHRHILVFKNQKGIILKMTIYIFNGGSANNKGFTVSFIEAGTKKRSREFDVFKNTFTLLS